MQQYKNKLLIISLLEYSVVGVEYQYYLLLLLKIKNDNLELKCTLINIDLKSLGYTKRFVNPDVKVAYCKDINL